MIIYLFSSQFFTTVLRFAIIDPAHTYLHLFYMHIGIILSVDLITEQRKENITETFKQIH